MHNWSILLGLNISLFIKENSANWVQPGWTSFGSQILYILVISAWFGKTLWIQVNPFYIWSLDSKLKARVESYLDHMFCSLLCLYAFPVPFFAEWSMWFQTYSFCQYPGFWDQTWKFDLTKVYVLGIVGLAFLKLLMLLKALHVTQKAHSGTILQWPTWDHVYSLAFY